MKKVAIYARASTTGIGRDLEVQLRDLRGYVESRGWETFKEYVDEGVSGGKKDKRPALDEMMNDAKKRYFDIVLVWKFDRFGRSTKHLVNSLEKLNHLSIDFVSYMEDIDMSSPAGKKMFTLVSAIAGFEADLMKERIMGRRP